MGVVVGLGGRHVSDSVVVFCQIMHLFAPTSTSRNIIIILFEIVKVIAIDF